MSSHPRLALVVAPRLLGDALARALREVGIDVVQVDSESPIPTSVDMAVVTEDVAVAVNAPVVLRLPGDDDGGMGGIRRGTNGEEPLALPDLDALVQTVRREGETVRREGETGRREGEPAGI